MMNEYLQTDQEFLSILRILRFRGCIISEDIPDFSEKYEYIFMEQETSMNNYSNKRYMKTLERQFDEDFFGEQKKEEFIREFSKLFKYKNNIQQQWFSHLQNFLVQESPFKVLTFCSPLLNIREILKKKLFKPAFAIAWKNIDKTRQSEIISKFHLVIENLKKSSKQTLKEILELIGKSSSLGNNQSS
jgi:hypothetical protein